MKGGFVLVEKQQLVQITEMAIDCLFRTIRNNPYFFYTESDLHCYLHDEICNRLAITDWQCVSKDGKRSVLLHKEYPTKERYDATALKRAARGKRGHFDLCIWNPEKTQERLFRTTSTNFEEEQQTFIAAELDLIEEKESLNQAVHHMRWDLLKLKGKKNEVEHGYSLIFVRDWIHRDKFLKAIMSEVKKEQNIVVLFAEKNGASNLVKTLTPKPFLDYENLLT
jgi:hypothetical protein